MTTYNKILKILEIFAINHPGVLRFLAGPIDEMSDMTSKHETFPVIYIAPLDAFISNDAEQIELRIYCYDRRMKDKSNYNPRLSDCLEILRDLDTWLRSTHNFQQIEINDISTIYPFENELMTDVDGWYMNVTLDVDSRGLCDLPFTESPWYGCVATPEPEPEPEPECCMIKDIPYYHLTISKLNHGIYSTYDLNNGGIPDIYNFLVTNETCLLENPDDYEKINSDFGGKPYTGYILHSFDDSTYLTINVNLLEEFLSSCWNKDCCKMKDIPMDKLIFLDGEKNPFTPTPEQLDAIEMFIQNHFNCWDEERLQWRKITGNITGAFYYVDMISLGIYLAMTNQDFNLFSNHCGFPEPDCSIPVYWGDILIQLYDVYCSDENGMNIEDLCFPFTRYEVKTDCNGFILNVFYITNDMISTIELTYDIVDFDPNISQPNYSTFNSSAWFPTFGDGDVVHYIYFKTECDDIWTKLEITSLPKINLSGYNPYTDFEYYWIIDNCEKINNLSSDILLYAQNNLSEFLYKEPVYCGDTIECNGETYYVYNFFMFKIIS